MDVIRIPDRSPLPSPAGVLVESEANTRSVRDPDAVRIALVRGPIVSTLRSVNNEATPCLGLAYLAAYAGNHGYSVEIVDAISEG